MGSPSYNFQFEILNSYDVLAIDSQYNIPVRAGSDAGTVVKIQQGQITVTQDSATPSGTSLSKGQSGVTLAKFDIYAAGEAVKVLYLPFQIQFTGVATTSNLSAWIQNVSIVDDAGGQVGSTINLPGSTSDTNSSPWTSADLYTSSFGSSPSPINYTIPANTTRVLSLRVDVQTGAGFSGVQAGLTSPVGNNLQGMISSQLGQTSAASGNTLTLSSSELTVTQDSSLGAQTLAANSINQKIGSFSFTASQSEGVTISNLNVGTNVSSSMLSNLKVMVNGARFGSTQATVGPSGLSGLANTYSFSGTPFTVPAGGTVTVGVYADVLSNATGNLGAVTNLAGLSGTGATSYTSVSLSPSTAVQGQTLAVASGGSSLTVSINSSYQPAAGQLSMGTTGNVLASLNFNETSNTEDVKLTSLALVDVASTTSLIPSFSNLTLWNGSQEVGSVQSYTATTTVSASSTPAFLYSFTNLLSNAVGTAFVPRNSVMTLTLKGDVNNYTTGNAADLSSHMFEVATSTLAGYSTTSSVVVAQGATSGKSASITLPAFTSSTATFAPIAGATTQTVLRNALVFSSTPVGSGSSRGKTSNDEVADLTFNASNGGSLLLNNATITFKGTAASSTGFIAAVKLLDPSGNAVPVLATSSDCSGGNSVCTVTFNLANRLVNGAQTYKLTVDDSLTAVAGGNNSVSLYATVAAPGDISYVDAADGHGTLTTLPSILQPGNQIFPLNLNSVTFSSGT
jgi:hypothetical protein